MRTVLIMLLVAAACGGCAEGSRGQSTANAEGKLHGTFIRWEPIDDAHGYAYFSVTNDSAVEAIANCRVLVFDEYGDFSFDYMGGQKVRPGETTMGKVKLDAGEGSHLPHSGEVTDC